MSDEGKIVEKHYHDPSQGQVNKALYQWLADQGLSDKLEKMVMKKVDEAVTRKIDAMLNGGQFDKLVLAAVAHVINNDKKAFEANSYGFANHVRDLINNELQRQVLDNYAITMTKKGG